MPGTPASDRLVSGKWRTSVANPWPPRANAEKFTLRTCHRHYPGRLDGACSLVSLHRRRPSLCNSQVGSCNCFFEACSAFTHVMACTLAESPSDPLHRKLRQLRCLRCRFDCYRVERTSSRAGVAPAEVQRLSRRTMTPTTQSREHVAYTGRRSDRLMNETGLA